MLFITLTILLFGLLNGQEAPIPPVKAITTATPLEVSDQAQAVNLACENIALKDIISFDTTVTNSDAIKFIVDKITSPLQNEVKFTTAGIYNIFVRADGVAADQAAKQNATQAIINKVSVTSIASVEAPNAVIKQAAHIRLNFTELSLLADDKVFFSIPDGNDAPTVKIEFPLTKLTDNYRLTSIVEPVTFATPGTYNVWIERKAASPLKQTGPNTTVFVLARSSGAITNAVPLYLTDATHTVSLSYYTGDVMQSDEISFSLDDTPSSSLKFNPSTATSPATGVITFIAGGEYNIFIKATGEKIGTKQEAKQIVYAKKLDNSIVSVVTATNVETNKPASIKFTHAPNTLYNGDFMIFSISNGENVSNDATNNQNITLGQLSFSGTEHTESLTFAKTGLYNIWIQRGNENAIKQTDKSVTVTMQTTVPASNLITKTIPAKLRDSTSGVAVDLECANLLLNDKIQFSLSDASGIIDSLTILFNETFHCPLQQIVPFPKGGVYSIFVTRTIEEVNPLSRKSGRQIITKKVEQTSVKQIVIEAISKSSLSKVEGVVYKENTTVPVTLEFPKLALYDDDIVIFSISADNNPAFGDTKTVDMKLANVDVSKTTHSQNVLFPSDGVYKIWIKRGDDTILQTFGANGGDTINGNMIRTSLILLIALFLF